MIVEPDFLDHWKTRLLVRLLGTETAPLVVLRLWAHCQQRKTDRFTGWKPTVLASVCRWDNPADTDGLTLWHSMIETRFIELQGEDVIVHGWSETNAFLVSAWSNGRRGGRPCKSKTSVESKTGRLSSGSTSVTDRVTYREEKRREEKMESIPPPPSPPPSSHESQSSNGEIVDAPEIPSEQEVLAFAATWPGDMARAIPGVIPEQWVLYFMAQLEERRAQWPNNWQPWLVRRFTSDYVAGFPRARGGASSAKSSATSGPSLLTQLRQVQEEIAKHPGNPDNGVGSLERKKAELPAFRELQKKMEAIKAQLNP